jgi:hypothetical protein
MNTRVTGAIVAAILVLSASVARAALIIEGSFSATFPGGSAVSSLEGDFQASFDDSVLVGTGSEAFEDQTILTSISLTPNPLGATNFDTTNVGLTLAFNDGTLTFLAIGGLIAHVGGISGDTDDFLVDFAGSGLPAISADYTIATESGISEYIGVEGSAAVTQLSVPEPGTFALLGIAMAGLGFMRRRSKRL